MSLDLQFQSIIASFGYGLVFGFGYGFYNRACFYLKWKWVRYILEACFDCAMIGIYFFMIVYLNGGHFNLYLFLSFAIGIIFYVSGFQNGYLRYLESVMYFFRWLSSPFRFIFRKIRVILKKSMRKVKRLGTTKKKTNE